jgi:hypothetical protein
MPVDQILARIRRALLLDVSVFEEARDDAPFTPFAILIAGGTALLAGFGAFLWSWIVLGDTGDFLLEATVLGTIFLLLLWLVGMIVTYFVLSQMYRETVTLDAVLRVMCLGHVPFALSALVFFWGFGFGFALIAVALTFFYVNYAVRAAYPAIDPMRVMMACAAGMAVWAMVLPLLTSPDNQFAPGPFVYEWSEDVAQKVIK